VPGLATALALILVGHAIFTLPFMVRGAAAALARPELVGLEEAARTLGARFLRRFSGVLLPAVIADFGAASLMVFTLSVGEFNLT
jgi:putative spermidine/putrescine transport system permease protein